VTFFAGLATPSPNIDIQWLFTKGSSWFLSVYVPCSSTMLSLAQYPVHFSYKHKCSMKNKHLLLHWWCLHKHYFLLILEGFEQTPNPSIKLPHQFMLYRHNCWQTKIHWLKCMKSSDAKIFFFNDFYQTCIFKFSNFT